MSIERPEFLILVPLVFYLARNVFHVSLRNYWHLGLLSIACLYLVDPRFSLLDTKLDVWVLLDRSASAEERIQPRLQEWEQLLESNRPYGDAIHFIEFADVASKRGENDPNYFLTPRTETNIPLAIRSALSARSTKRNSRLLLFTDGYSTESLRDMGELLAKAKVPLDYRIPAELVSQDLQLDELIIPERVQKGESFLIEVRASSNTAVNEKIPLKLVRDGLLIYQGALEFTNGRASIKLADRLEESSRAFRYEAEIDPPTDRFSGNNRATRWTEVTGEKKVVILSGYQTDPLAAILSGRGYSTQVASKPQEMNIGLLTHASVVILNNINAASIPKDFLKALDFFVQSQGGGLLMTGGLQSFGNGGYYQSEIDSLLPVSMELKEEERRISISMVLALDRSGSMGASVSGNFGNMQKMDLANEGAARTISLLNSQDQIAVLAVDSESHSVVEPTTIGTKRDDLMGKARSVRSAGGGIFVYVALQAAWDLLKNEKERPCHIILFADAGDAEEPGDYKMLLAEIVSKKATVSVIGLGRETDHDGELLKEIAGLGNGRMFFVSDAMELPSVFAQETVSVARSTFVKQLTPVTSTANWKSMSSFSLPWLKEVDGYNLNYLRPKAQALLLSGDEYRSPIFAAWQKGIGRVATIGFPVAGDYSERVRAWPQYGDFLQSTLHWLRGPELPVGAKVRTRLNGKDLSVEFSYSENWNEHILKSAPRLLVSSKSIATSELPWERIAPGEFRRNVRIEGNDPLRGIVQVGEYALPFGPVTAQRGAEWDFNRARIRELEHEARVSGGGERVNIGDIWNSPRDPQEFILRPWLLSAFLLLFLVEALVTRIAGLKHVKELFVLPTRVPRVKTKQPRGPAPIEIPEVEAAAPSAEPKPQESVFDRAKRKGL